MHKEYLHVIQSFEMENLYKYKCYTDLNFSCYKLSKLINICD